jgi:hypothetical protein
VTAVETKTLCIHLQRGELPPIAFVRMSLLDPGAAEELPSFEPQLMDLCPLCAGYLAGMIYKLRTKGLIDG